jgi:hypothetical protein
MNIVKMKRAVLFVAVMSLIFLPLKPSFAEGKFKDKLQQRLNAQTNIQYQNVAPSNYEPYYSTSEFNAVAVDGRMTRSDLVQSESKALSSPDSSIPGITPYAIYQTDYKAELEENVVTVKGNVVFEVFRKKGIAQIPLMNSSVGLIDVSLNNKAAFIIMQGGKYYLMVDQAGRYTLNVEFLVKASREREGGPGSFAVDVVPAPISQFEFTMPESDVEIFIDPSIKTEVRREPKRTIAWAVMPNTTYVQARWTKALPKEDIKPVKLEPKVYVDTATYVTIGEGIVRCQASLNYSILQSEISNLSVILPDDVSVLDVNGRDLRDWKVSQKDGLQRLDVFLNFGIKGNYNLNLVYERNIGEGSVVAEIPAVTVSGVEREKGFFGIAAITNVELEANKIEGVSEVDTKELPSSVWSSSANPILLAFKYLKHPFSISIEVTRHEELPVLVAAIDSVNYVTLYTEEGKVLTKASYQVRNNVKQFIRIDLPKDAILWSSFVAGKPVKPAKDKNNSVLIPLEKSQIQGESLTQFPVEVVYLDKGRRMGLLGAFKLNLPKVDIPISKFYWSVYLPLDYMYFNFGGDVRRDTESPGSFARGSGMLGGLKKTAMAQRSTDDYATQYAREEQVMFDQVSQQQDEGIHRKGVLPIKVEIPEQGRFMRFSKLLVTEEDNLWLSANYVRAAEKIRFWFKFLVICGLIMFLFIRIKNSSKKK